MDVKISPGNTTRKILIHLSSAKIKLNCLLNKKNIKHKGIATAIVNVSPAVITFLARSGFPSARYLVISLETVIGVPATVSVKSNAKTESAT